MAKKQTLIDAAIELFAENGIEATSVQQITDKCNISKGAFYLIFKSKEELILSIIDYFMQMYSEEIDHAVNSTTVNEEKLYQYFIATLKFFEKYKSLALIFLREQNSTFSEKAVAKLMHYEQIGNQNLALLLEEIYGLKVQQIKYDIIITMQGMLQAYISKLLFMKQPMPLQALADMFVEKINILVEHSKLAVFTNFPSTGLETPISLDKILADLKVLQAEQTDSLILQSIEVLLEELPKKECNKAIILGVTHHLNATSAGQFIAKSIQVYLGAS